MDICIVNSTRKQYINLRQVRECVPHLFFARQQLAWDLNSDDIKLAVCPVDCVLCGLEEYVINAAGTALISKHIGKKP